MEIIFSDERKPGESILQKMYQAAELCLAKKDLDPERVTVSVTFVSSEEMKELNALYRNVDRVTDVLSFPLTSAVNSQWLNILIFLKPMPSFRH